MQPPLIQVLDVEKKFKDIHAVKKVSLEIHQGEYVALLGPNGAGKTTLVEMIEGIQMPNSGQILIDSMEWLKNKKRNQSYFGYFSSRDPFHRKVKMYRDHESLFLFLWNSKVKR